MSANDEMSGPSEFGRWLYETRTRKGIRVDELAERSGVSFVQIYNIEAGRSQNPQSRTREKLAKALGEAPDANVVSATEESATIEDVGELVDFDPHDLKDRPNEPGVYVFYDISDRPIYVGQTQSIRDRIQNDHSSRFWFKAPLVQAAAYVRIEDQSLRKKIEKVMIKFMRSTAVLNRHHVDRDA